MENVPGTSQFPGMNDHQIGCTIERPLQPITGFDQNEWNSQNIVATFTPDVPQ